MRQKERTEEQKLNWKDLRNNREVNNNIKKCMKMAN